MFSLIVGRFTNGLSDSDDALSSFGTTADSSRCDDVFTPFVVAISLTVNSCQRKMRFRTNKEDRS